MDSDSPVGCGFLGAAILAGLGIVGCAVANSLEYSQGARIGVINKFSKKGFIWKTYEGQLALEGILSEGGQTGANVWDFSIDNSDGKNIDDLSAKIQEYMGRSQKVKVTYFEPWKTWPWRSETDYLIQSVEPVEKKE